MSAKAMCKKEEEEGSIAVIIFYRALIAHSRRRYSDAASTIKQQSVTFDIQPGGYQFPKHLDTVWTTKFVSGDLLPRSHMRGLGGNPKSEQPEDKNPKKSF